MGRNLRMSCSPNSVNPIASPTTFWLQGLLNKMELWRGRIGLVKTWRELCWSQVVFLRDFRLKHWVRSPTSSTGPWLILGWRRHAMNSSGEGSQVLLIFDPSATSVSSTTMGRKTWESSSIEVWKGSLWGIHSKAGHTRCTTSLLWGLKKVYMWSSMRNPREL